jgi:hypothetical protein
MDSTWGIGQAKCEKWLGHCCEAPPERVAFTARQPSAGDTAKIVTYGSTRGMPSRRDWPTCFKF